jgi:pimeloyl-ACP methyl ester carboxylesterase
VEDFLFLFFSPSPESDAADRRYWDRLQERVGEREPPVPQRGIQAQVAAITAWSQGNGSAYSRLGEIKIPVLVANGSNDIMVPTINSFIMSQRIPNARLILYPDSGHGFLFQYPEEFVGHALGFLN